MNRGPGRPVVLIGSPQPFGAAELSDAGAQTERRVQWLYAAIRPCKWKDDFTTQEY